MQEQNSKKHPNNKRISRTCERCSLVFEVSPSASASRFCSKRCCDEAKRRVQVTKRCPRCGVKFTTADKGQGTRKYCRKGCGPDKEFTCEICTKVFTLPYYRWHSKENRGSCCSKPCMIVKMKAFRVKGDLARRVTVRCAACGTDLQRSLSATKNKEQHFCNEACQRAHWDSRTIERTCKWCGLNFERNASQLDGDGGNRRCQFCSKSCAGAYTIRHCQTRVSAMEIRFFDLLEKCGIRINRQCRVDRYNVDALIQETSTIIEFDGAYWHDRPDTSALDAKKDECFRSKGFNVIRVRDLEFKRSPNQTVQRIVEQLQVRQVAAFSK